MSSTAPTAASPATADANDGGEQLRNATRAFREQHTAVAAGVGAAAAAAVVDVGRGAAARGGGRGGGGRGRGGGAVVAALTCSPRRRPPSLLQ